MLVAFATRAPPKIKRIHTVEGSGPSFEPFHRASGFLSAGLPLALYISWLIHSDFCLHRYKDLINTFPNKIKSDRYIALILNKLAQYGSVSTYTYHTGFIDFCISCSPGSVRIQWISCQQIWQCL